MRGGIRVRSVPSSEMLHEGASLVLWVTISESGMFRVLWYEPSPGPSWMMLRGALCVGLLSMLTAKVKVSVAAAAGSRHVRTKKPRIPLKKKRDFLFGRERVDVEGRVGEVKVMVSSLRRVYLRENV